MRSNRLREISSSTEGDEVVTSGHEICDLFFDSLPWEGDDEAGAASRALFNPYPSTQS
jgi:hypothetical protein